MSWLEELSHAPLLETVGLYLAIGVALLGMVLVSIHLFRAQREVERLQREVVVFAEASARVADTLDQLLLGNVAATRVSHTSRRYLLAEAQAGLGAGEVLDVLAQRLGLSHDEVRLLRCSHQTHRTPQAA